MNEKTTEAFFDEMEKIATFPTRAVTLGALLAAVPSAARSIANEPKERAKDEQAHLTPEQVKRSRRRRLLGGLGGATAAALGGGAAGYVGGTIGKKVDALQDNLKMLGGMG